MTQLSQTAEISCSAQASTRLRHAFGRFGCFVLGHDNPDRWGRMKIVGDNHLIRACPRCDRAFALDYFASRDRGRLVVVPISNRAWRAQMTKDTATDRTGQTPAKREYDPLIRDLIVKTQALRFGVTSDEMAASLDALQTHVEALQRRGDDNLGIAERSITQLATSVARGEALQAKLEKALAAVGPLDLESPDGEQALDATAQALWEKVAQLERGDRRAIAWAQAGDEERTKWRSLARSSIFAYETARARVAMLK